MLQADRVKETTTTTGIGTLTLLGAVANFFSFATKYPAASTSNIPYTVVDDTNVAVEGGYGTFTLSGTTFTRDIVTFSSNGGARVNFVAGTKTIFVGLLAAAAAWPLVKTSVDTGEVLVIPAGYQMQTSGDFSLNGGDVHLYGDWILT